MMVKKFDVVIGNPPYQLKEANSKNTKLLYTEFVYKAKELSDRVLFVIPSNYLTGNKGPLKTFREFIKKNGLIEISEDKSEYFASVDTAGISILNLDDSSKDTFIFDNVEVANDLTNSKIVTNFKAAKLYEDLCSSSNKLNCSRGKRGIYKASVEEYSKEPTDKLNVPMFLNSRGGEPVVVYVEPNSKMDVSADHFALVTQDWNKTDLTFNNVWYRKVKHFTSNLNFIYFILKEDETYENFLTYVNSNLFKFLLKHSDTGSRALPIGSLKQFPTVDFNRSWTDETLYAEFGLSPENITVIESFV